MTLYKPVQEMVDEEIERLNGSRKHKGSGKYKPSLLGYCFRRQYWERKGEEKTNPPDARALRVFKVGDFFHRFVQDLLVSADRGQVEVLVENENYKGYADFVSDTEVVDIKSQHSKAFWYMNKTDDIKKDKYNNFLQCAFYAFMLHKPSIRLVFISKDDLCVQEFRQDIEGYWMDEVLKEVATLDELWGKGLPNPQPRLYFNKDGQSKECGYCPYLDLCKGGKEATNGADKA